MDLATYFQKVKDLETEHIHRKKELMRKFVNENNPYKIGDTVTDHVGSIIIEKISYSRGYNSAPYAIYFGVELNKNGSVNKKGNKRCVHQVNIL